MIEYNVTIETLSDTMLGSGESIPGFIDNDIKYDEYGIPYMFAKTLKGLIREQMEMLKEYASKDYAASIEELLGSTDIEGEKKLGKLKFTNVEVLPEVKYELMKAIQSGEVTPSEILDAMTVTYSSTRIDNTTGTYAPHSLRRERMVKKGILFQTKVYLDVTEYNKDYDKMIKDSFQALQHIGTHKSKGKGHVKCTVEVKK